MGGEWARTHRGMSTRRAAPAPLIEGSTSTRTHPAVSDLEEVVVYVVHRRLARVAHCEARSDARHTLDGSRVRRRRAPSPTACDGSVRARCNPVTSGPLRSSTTRPAPRPTPPNSGGGAIGPGGAVPTPPVGPVTGQHGTGTHTMTQLSLRGQTRPRGSAHPRTDRSLRAIRHERSRGDHPDPWTTSSRDGSGPFRPTRSLRATSLEQKRGLCPNCRSSWAVPAPPATPIASSPGPSPRHGPRGLRGRAARPARLAAPHVRRHMGTVGDFHDPTYSEPREAVEPEDCRG